MSNIDSFLNDKSTPATKSSGTDQIDSFLSDAPVQGRGALGFARDAGVALAKGIIGVPEAGVGIADLVTGGQAGKLAESAGIRFKDAKDALSELYTPQQQAANKEVNDAKGFFPTVGAMLRNPSTIADQAIESAPTMITGGLAARGLMAAVPRISPILAGAFGEGATAAGQNAEQVRQEDPNGTLSPTQAGILAASGALTGGIGFGAGKLANKLGIGDINTMLASGKLGAVGDDAIATGASKGFLRKAGEGAAVEGVLQELPQSYQEQVAQNIAQGKPWDQGAAEAGAQGMLAGGLMGAAGGPLHGGHDTAHVDANNQVQPAAESQQAQPVLALPAPTYTVDSDGNVMNTADQNAAVQNNQGGGNIIDVTPVPQSPEPQAQPTLALPAPTYSVGSDGTVRTTADDNADIQMQRQADQDRIERIARGEINDITPIPQAPKLSEQMGIDPNAGSMSSAAAIAVDSGASQHLANLQAEQQAADLAQKQAKKGTQGSQTGDLTSAAQQLSPLATASDNITSSPLGNAVSSNTQTLPQVNSLKDSFIENFNNAPDQTTKNKLFTDATASGVKSSDVASWVAEAKQRATDSQSQAQPIPEQQAAPTYVKEGIQQAQANAKAKQVNTQQATTDSTSVAPTSQIDPATQWSSMTPAQRMVVSATTDIKPVIARNMSKVSWDKLNPDVQQKLASSMQSQANQDTSFTPPKDVNDLASQWVDAHNADDKVKKQQLLNYGNQNFDQATMTNAVNDAMAKNAQSTAKVAPTVKQQLTVETNKEDQIKAVNGAMAKSAKTPASPTPQPSAQKTVIDTAAQVEAQPAVAKTDLRTQSQTPPNIKAIVAKQIPDMTDAELQQAVDYYGPSHARTAKLNKAIEKRGLSENAPGAQSAPTKPTSLKEGIALAQANAKAKAAQAQSNVTAEQATAEDKPFKYKADPNNGMIDHKDVIAMRSNEHVNVEPHAIGQVDGLVKFPEGAEYGEYSVNQKNERGDSKRSLGLFRFAKDGTYTATKDRWSEPFESGKFDTSNHVQSIKDVLNKFGEKHPIVNWYNGKPLSPSELKAYHEKRAKDNADRDAEMAAREQANQQVQAEPVVTGSTSAIESAAHEAATSPQNDKPEPTDAQKEAGNYAKGHVRVHGLDISIENPQGSERSGKREDGSTWTHTMSDHYGYIKRTEGADGDHVDVYVGKNPDATHAYVVDQLNQKTGGFDEHKVMLGFNDQESAVQAYKSNFDKGWKVGPVTAMTTDEFKTWLKDGDTTKPVANTTVADNPTKKENFSVGDQSSKPIPNSTKNTPAQSIRDGIANFEKNYQVGMSTDDVSIIVKSLSSKQMLKPIDGTNNLYELLPRTNVEFNARNLIDGRHVVDVLKKYDLAKTRENDGWRFELTNKGVDFFYQIGSTLSNDGHLEGGNSEKPNHLFQKYDDVAKQYGRSVTPKGNILSSSGKDTGARITEKRGRMRVEGKDGSLLFSGNKPESLGSFLERYWGDKKTEQSKDEKSLFSRQPSLKPDKERKGASPFNTVFGRVNFSAVQSEVDSIMSLLNASLGSRNMKRAGGNNHRALNWSVVASFSDLPAEIKESAEKQGSDGTDIEGVLHKNTMYVVADNVRGDAERKVTTLQRVQEVVFHEIYGHLGVHQLFGTDYPKKLQELFNAVGGLDGVRKIANQHNIDLEHYIEPYMGNADKAGYWDKAEAQRAVMDELLAHIAQTNKVTIKVKLKEYVGAIRQWLRDHGFAKLADYNDSDLFHILKQARHAVFTPINTQNNDIRFSRKEDMAFVHDALNELTDHDEIFRHAVSQKHSIQGVFSDVAPSVKYLGRTDLPERHEDTKADYYYQFETKDGKPFKVSGDTNNQVWIDVSELQKGDGGSGIYAAVGNWAHNAKKKFIGDPLGLSDDAVVARTKAMLSLALRFGTTDFMKPAEEQRVGNVKAGVPQLKWGSSDVENVRHLIDTFLETTRNKTNAFEDYHYDFDKRGFFDSEGRPVELSRFESIDHATNPDLKAARAGSSTARRYIFLKSLVSSESSERPELLEKLQYWNRALAKSPDLQGLFSTKEDEPTSKAPLQTPAQVRKQLVDRFGADTIRKLEQDGKLEIVPTHTDGDVEGFYQNGKVTLVAGNLSPSEVIPTMLHELGGHAGMQGVMRPDAYQSIVDSFNKLVAAGNPVALRAKARATIAEKNQATRDLEYIPYLITESVNAQDSNVQQRLAITHFIKRVIAAVRAFAFDKLGIPLNLTPDDMVALAERMVNQVADSKISQSGSNLTVSNQPLYSRAGIRDIAGMATTELNKRFSAPGKLSAWHKTVGTMYNLAERSSSFKPVFNAAQNFIDDVSFYASEAAELAPQLLPKLENWKDIAKSPISAEDNNAVAKPIFEGTLLWGRDRDGTPVLVDTLAEAASKLSTERKAQILEATGNLPAGIHKAWKALPAEKYAKMIDSRYETTFLKPGVVWTDDELKSHFNLNDAQIALYHEFRDSANQSLDSMTKAEMLRIGSKDVKDMRDQVMSAKSVTEASHMLMERLNDIALTEPDRATSLMQAAQDIKNRAESTVDLQAAGYAPLSRFGKYSVDVVQDGERQYFGLFETAYEANKMAEKMRAEFGKDNVTQGTLSAEAYKLFAGITPESLELFGNMLGLNSDGDKAQDQAFQEYIRLTKNNRSAMKRLIHRKGIAGYSEDVGRVLASFIYSNARQTAGGLHMGDLDEAVQDIPKGEGELTDVAVKLRDYIKNPQEEAQAVRGLLFAQFLGGSIASALVNMTQPIAVTFPYLSQYGGAGKAAAQLTKAAKQIASKRNQFEPDLAAALKRAEEDGTVSPQEVHQLMAQARGKGSLTAGDGSRLGDARALAQNTMSRFSLAWGKLFGAAEQLNRQVTFIAAYRIAKDQGMANPDEFARHVVKETQFVYSKASKMQWGRGAIGGTLMTFKTFNISYLELMNRLWNKGEAGSDERKQGRKAALIMLATMLVLSGAGGLPFADDLNDLIDGLAQIAGYNFSTKKAKQEFLEDTFGKPAADFIDRGITGLPGMPLDVAGRLGMSNLIPGTGLLKQSNNHTNDVMEIAGPAGKLASNILSGANSIANGDIKSGLLQMAPQSVQNAAKGADMATTGMYRDSKGYKVLETNELEAALKAIGFQPSSVSDIQEANGLNQSAKAFYNMKKQDISSMWAQGIFEQDSDMVQKARDQISDWNNKNPDQPMVINIASVLRKAREMNKSKDERIAATAPKAMRAQMKQEIEQRRLEYSN